MDIYRNLLVNFSSIFATILLACVTSVIVFRNLKLRWPVKVNCWFCNTNSKIPRQELDWWLCPSCEQYNGFLKDGDYAYSIPEQCKMSLNNIKRYCTPNQNKSTNESTNYNLCKRCTTNETLKLSKLSMFEPVHEKRYDYEVKRFKDGLEEKYPLCSNCKATVRTVLHKQAQWLARYKMLFFKQKAFSEITKNAKYLESTYRIISTLLGAVVAYNVDCFFLPIGGLFFHSCAFWVAPAKKMASDILLALFWICIVALTRFKDVNLMILDSKSEWFFHEYLTQYHVIVMLASIIGIVNIKSKYYKHPLNNNVSFKKIDSCVKDMPLTGSCTINDRHNLDSKVISSLTESVNNYQALNAINDVAPVSMDKPANRTISQSPVAGEEYHALQSTFHGNMGPNSASVQKTNGSSGHSWNDSLNTLSTLALSEDLPKSPIRTSNVFERKLYNTKSPDIFKKLTYSSGRKHILSPPKLKSVMQTSWVAGGYWQEGIDVPSLSRSSSQSSGFGSVGSNFAPSREPSVHEFDQCSVVSDGAQSCYTFRRNSVSPVGSFNQQGSHFSFVEPKTPIFPDQMIKSTPNYVISPQPLLVSRYQPKHNATFTDQYLQGQRINVGDIQKSSEMQILPSHTTIITSPVWLSALLCCSLVVNIIVLCTTLAR